MIIGITGRSGAGKSYLSDKLAEQLGFLHVDVDKISHEILTFDETKKFLLNEFGNSIFDDGILNRKKLGKIVFENQEKLAILNNFCIGQIERKLYEIISSNENVILDYALLCGLKQFEVCDIKILLIADFDTRFSRAKVREQISKEYFASRDNSIPEFDNSKFDFVFTNISASETNSLINTIKSKM